MHSIATRPTGYDWATYWITGMAIGLLGALAPDHSAWEGVLHIIRISLMRPLLITSIRRY